MRNLQEQVKKALCYPKLFWPFTAWINCSSDLKNFANPRPSALNFKSFSRSLEQLFLTVGQNNFGNKIPFLGPRVETRGQQIAILQKSHPVIFLHASEHGSVRRVKTELFLDCLLSLGWNNICWNSNSKEKKLAPRIFHDLKYEA